MSKNHVLNVDFHAKCKDVPIFSPAQESLSQVLFLRVNRAIGLRVGS